MKNYRFLAFVLLVILNSCYQAEQEFPLYKMNGLNLDQVHLGGILAEYFYEDTIAVSTPEVVKAGELDEILSELLIKAQVYANQGDESLLKACESKWDSIVNNYHLSIGLPAECFNDSFSGSGMLNWVLFNREMLQITADPKYADQLERAAYNAVLGNPASSSQALDSLSTVVYTRYLDEVNINLFGSSSMEYYHTTGGTVRIIQETNYPYDGLVKLKFETDDKRYVNLRIRIPEWAQKASVTVGGVKYKAVPGEYAQVTKKWKTGDEVEIILPMRPLFSTTKNGEAFTMQYGSLNMISSTSDRVDKGKKFQPKGGEAYQYLKFLSPPGEIPTFTFNGYQDTTLLLQPYFIVKDRIASSCHFPWIN